MNLPPSVSSPLTGREHAAFLKRRVASHSIIAQYREQFGYDTHHYFSGLPEVGVYECSDTGFRFFYPFSIAGDESLYLKLQEYEWNYQEEKWEHIRALSSIRRGQLVLDVGCGEGAFLDKAHSLAGAVVTGIELNRAAATVTRSKGIDVREEMLDSHAVNFLDHYDVVTSFQVLEHIAQPADFIADCLRVLKPGGLLIYGVPNDDSFLKFANAPLNGPPHHMGLWTRTSLNALCDLFPMDLHSLEVQPLQEIDWYQAVMEARYLPSRWQRGLYYRLGGKKIFRQYLAENAESISGHTVVAIFRKHNHI